MPSQRDLPSWERLLSAAARLQQIVPGTVLGGGTDAALFARHRLSHDADHVASDPRARFDAVLLDLESAAGWQTARINRPVLILGSLDGIQTGIRQLIRQEPLETEELTIQTDRPIKIVVPTAPEMLRIKAFLILRRNATRDYVDTAALSAHLGPVKTAAAFKRFDAFYPQPNGASPLQQLLIQLAHPKPYDLAETNLGRYKDLAPEWQEWTHVAAALAKLPALIFAHARPPAQAPASRSAAATPTHPKRRSRPRSNDGVEP